MQEIKDKIISRTNYVSKDLAIIIPTNNRPKEVGRLLQSIKELDCEVRRVIVVASGQDISDVIMTFAEYIPIEYYSSEPGQIRQRNKGIALLDESTCLVATMDDDAVFHKDAVSEMIKFWNNVETETAGVGFNIVNINGNKHNWFRGLLGMSAPEPGKVLKSGNNTSICNVKESIRSEWLSGGGTVWRQEILKKYPHYEIKSGWAVCEDIIFSYPKSKKYTLYVCQNSKIEVEAVVMTGEQAKLYHYRGKAQFLWRLYFVLSNKELSVVHFICFQCIYLIALFMCGLLYKDRNRLSLASGVFSGLAVFRKVQFNKQKIIKYIEKNT